jgi:dipeptidyl-peptidase 4
MSLLMLCKEPGLVSAAVAGAPVTDWAGYDTAYTERYMGRPKPFAPAPVTAAAAGSQDDRRGDTYDVRGLEYESSSVMSHLGGLVSGRSRLLLVHGLIDENVHVRHSWRLLSALTTAGAPADGICELLLLPGERHCVREPSAKALVTRRTVQFFRDVLGVADSPSKQ